MTEVYSPENIFKAESGELRSFNRVETSLVGAVALTWALFQLSLASWLILDSISTRAIHLAFALVLIFLQMPFLKKGSVPFLSQRKGVPFIDYILAAGGIFAALYIMIEWKGLVTRMGSLLPMDIAAGSLLVIILLEGTRRSTGPALPVITLLFSLWAFFAPYFPSIFAAKAVSLNKYINQISLSSEGIYGIPLGVSATIVFLFVLLGSMLERAGAGHFFTTLALSFLGKYKGGPAKASVISSGLTGMISGSSIANIVTTGTFTIPLMKKVGYPAKKAAAIEVAASTDGQLMPPIMGAAAFIIAEYVNIPYVEVIKAAAIPALVSYMALFYVTHLEASKLNMEGMPEEEIPSFINTMKEGFHYLIPIAVLLYELIVLRRSPELAAFMAIATLIPVILIQEVTGARKDDKSILGGLKKGILLVTAGMIKGAKNMVVVALATASAGIIVGVVGMGLGGMITEGVEILSMGNVFLLLLITAAASLLLGMGLPTTATYIVMASLTAPIIVKVGGAYGLVIPLIASHLFCFYFGILADDTPPVGLAAYAASAIAKSDPIATGLQGFTYDLRTAIIPFFFIFNPDLLLYNIHSLPLALLIFVMAVLGAFAFTSSIQGWLAARNRWYHVPFLLISALLLFHPAMGTYLFHLSLDVKYFFYIPGVLLLGGVYFWQKISMNRSAQSV